MKAKKVMKSLMLLFAAVCMLSSCASKEDKLVGSWSRSFGLNSNPYTELRAFSSKDTHPTFSHTFVFEKGNDGKGTFKDVVSPLAIGLQSGQHAVGSKITGRWEIKDNKLCLYYEDEVTLINADDLEPELVEMLEEQITKEFLDKYKSMGANGLPYEFQEKNNKTGIIIQFDSDNLVFVKKKEEEK